MGDSLNEHVHRKHARIERAAPTGAIMEACGHQATTTKKCRRNKGCDRPPNNQSTLQSSQGRFRGPRARATTVSARCFATVRLEQASAHTRSDQCTSAAKAHPTSN